TTTTCRTCGRTSRCRTRRWKRPRPARPSTHGQPAPPVIILGVDPGSVRTGYGAIHSDGRRHRLVEHGALCPPPKLPLPERLHRIHEGLAALIARIHPDCLAVEDVFHAVNSRSALVLGHVRGVVLLAGADAGLPVSAFPPAT